MRFLIFFAGLSFLFTGCAPKFMEEMKNNQYLEKIVFSDKSAPYLGEWTSATSIGLTAIKIRENGTVIMCSSNQYFGNSNGKVFKEEGKVKIIFESGTQYEILSANADHLITSYQGHDYIFYLGKVPGSCKEIFGRFASQ